METRSHPIRVLLVEDDEDDYVMVRGLLSDISAQRHKLERVTDYDAAREDYIHGEYDVCLLANRLDKRNGLDLLNEVLGDGPNVAIILLTGQGDSAAGIEAINAGAADSLVKEEVSANLLERSIRYAMERMAAKQALQKVRDELEIRVREHTEESIRANETMQESEHFARYTLNALSANIAILDDEGFILCTNQSWKDFARSNGSVELSFEGVNYLYVCDRAEGQWAGEAPMAAAGIRDVLSGRRDGFDLEYPCHSPDEKRWFNMRVTRFRNHESVQVVVAHENITERKLAEEALESQRARMQAVLDNMPAGVTMFEGEPLKPVLVNRLGEQLLGRSVPTVITSDELASFFQVYRAGTDELYPVQCMPVVRAMSGDSVSVDDMEIRRLDGSGVRLEVFGAPVRDAMGGITGAVAIFQDITGRKQVEAALRESEQLYRSLFENMLNGFAYCRMIFERNRPTDFIYLTVNSAFEALTGLKNVTGRRVSEVIPGIREHDPILFEIYGRVALTGIPERFEAYVQAMGMWFSISVYSPQREYFVAVFDAITERKEAEETLRKSEERFRELAENIREVFWVETFDEMLYVSPAYEEIWGRSCESLYEDPDSFMEFVHPADRERVLHAYIDDHEGKVPFDEEYRIIRPDGSMRWIWARSFPISEQGGIVRTVGIAEDITTLKEAEEFLRIERDLAFGLGSASSMVEAMQYLLEASLKFDGMDSGGIYLVEGETGALKLNCHQGLSDDFVERVSFYEATSPQAHFVMRGEAGYWSRSADIFEMGDLLEREGLLALAAIPVKSEGEVVALLNLASHVQSEVPRNVRSAIEVIAAHIGGVVSRLRLGEKLKAQSEGLQEANAALKVLLKQREQDRAELEESLLENVKHLILPNLDKLKSSRPSEDQRLYLEIVESHLKEVTSPFVRKVSARFLGLTPTEIRVSDLIRYGKTSKEIAELLGTSERAVQFHRQSIRGKLGLKQKKINLQTYLASFT